MNWDKGKRQTTGKGAPALLTFALVIAGYWIVNIATGVGFEAVKPDLMQSVRTAELEIDCAVPVFFGNQAGPYMRTNYFQISSSLVLACLTVVMSWVKSLSWVWGMLIAAAATYCLKVSVFAIGGQDLSTAAVYALAYVPALLSGPFLAWLGRRAW